MKKRTVKKIAWIVSVLIIFFLGIEISHAYTAVHIDIPTKSVAPGSEVGAFIYIESDEPINAFFLELSYPGDALQFIRSSDVESIVDIWRQKPTIVERDTIRASGGMITPFTGEKKLVSLLHFRAFENFSQEETFSLAVKEAHVYRADGTGGSFEPNQFGTNITISPQSSRYSLVYREDDSAPEVRAEVISLPQSNKFILSFKSEDDESGIEKTEVRFFSIKGWGEWQLTENPVSIPGGNFVAQIRSKNNAGITAIHTVFIWREIVKKLFFGIGIIGVLILSRRI